MLLFIVLFQSLRSDLHYDVAVLTQRENSFLGMVLLFLRQMYFRLQLIETTGMNTLVEMAVLVCSLAGYKFILMTTANNMSKRD